MRRLVPIALISVVLWTAAAREAHAEGPGLERQTVAIQVEGPAPVGGTVYGAPTRPPLHPFDRKAVKFSVNVYGWLTDVSGESFTDGQGTSFEIPFEELANYVNAGFMGYAEVRWRRWSLALDSYVAELKGDAPTGTRLLDARWTVDNLLLDVRLGYTVWERCLGYAHWGGCVAKRTIGVDALIGARYWKQDLGVELSTPLLPGRGLPLASSEEWWDPYVGARLRWDVAKRWMVSLYGDVGGFGLGDASELTWQIQGGVGFRLTRQFHVFLGYRVLDLDRTTGSGATKNGTTTSQHGPLLGAGIAF